MLGEESSSLKDEFRAMFRKNCFLSYMYWQKMGFGSFQVKLVARLTNKVFFLIFGKIAKRDKSLHTAPEGCQPAKLATLSFSAFLVVCDQDKKPHVGQQILKGGNFCQLTSLLLHHHLSVSFTNSSWNHCFSVFSQCFWPNVTKRNIAK